MMKLLRIACALRTSSSPTLLRAMCLLAMLLMLSACQFLPPNEIAMQRAIGDYVLEEEDYPKEFLKAENFVFSNLQKVEGSKPSQYTVNAEFDLAYTADGQTIVAALKQRARNERDKEKRRTDSPFDEIASAVRGAFKGYGYERRFESVKVGDKDHYRGSFTLIQNADNSWSVSSASYQ
jgi:hypothetical protein